MSAFQVKLSWQHDASQAFDYKTYSRTHTWQFPGGVNLEASAAPAFLGKAEYPNPEEAFIAALSSCHMLTFLAIAAFKKFHVESYEDNASGEVTKNDAGKMAVTTVTLKPFIKFVGDAQPSQDELMAMHEKAHKECFIANSVTTAVKLEPVW